MARLINNRFYFDYNATSPLATTVIQWLASGDFPFANPSSIHSSGKRSKRFINETTEFLKDLFDLKKHRLFFHSGATEGINSLIQGHAKAKYKKGEKLNFFYASTDHSCIFNQKEELELYGHKPHCFSVDKNGDFDKDALIASIKKASGPCLLNFTHVNNESGVVWDLDWASEIKKETGCMVHVDAVQAPGKVRDWWQLNSDLDAYTFSAHKFGGMKGVGFSFLSDKYSYSPILRGGGQQNALRSGTENVIGIYSIKLALEELKKNFDFDKLKEAKLYLEGHLINTITDKGEVVGRFSHARNANTLYFILYKTKAQTAVTAFDLADMDVSTGSACSSGAVLPSRVLKNMGYSEEEAKSAIRLSFSPTMTMDDAKEYWEKIQKIVSRYV